jgi:hypothetical protein
MSASRIFVLSGMRGFRQRSFYRQPLVRGTQATAVSALPSMQSSSIVFASRWVACCCPNISSKRTAPPPLNSSVRRQSSILLLSVAFLGFRLRFGKAHRVVSGCPALSSVARLVGGRILRALSHLVFLCSAVRAVCRNVASVASGSFFVRRPQVSRHCRAFKAALSCRQRVAQRAGV